MLFSRHGCSDRVFYKFQSISSQFFFSNHHHFHHIHHHFKPVIVNCETSISPSVVQLSVSHSRALSLVPAKLTAISSPGRVSVRLPSTLPVTQLCYFFCLFAICFMHDITCANSYKYVETEKPTKWKTKYEIRKG